MQGTNVGLVINGPVNEPFRLERSSDLEHWQTLGIYIVTGLATFDNLDVTGPRFYRARLHEDTTACGTNECFQLYYETNPAGAGCAEYGPPDNPTNRNASIPTSSTPIKTIRLAIHQLTESAESPSPISTNTLLLQVLTLNAHFLPWRIQFVAQIFTHVAPSHLRRLRTPDDEAALRETYSIDPSNQHNVFLTDMSRFSRPYKARSTSPWESDALTTNGGTVIDAILIGYGRTALTHELGHALGLRHVFHGVNEVPDPCTNCWERADGSAADTTGDRCSDTPPVPMFVDCVTNAGFDTCSSGRPWSVTSLRNFMSYAICRDSFTPQQAGRMHCWITNRLSGWLDFDTPPAPSDLRVATNDFGEIFLTWTDNASNESGYRIERVGPDGTFEILLPAETTRFTDLNAAPETPYTYRVQALNGAFVSYLAVASTRTSPAPFRFCVDPANIVPPDPWCERVFPTLRDAYEAASKPAILRFQTGRYIADFRLEKVLRLEPTNGPVRIEPR